MLIALNLTLTPLALLTFSLSSPVRASQQQALAFVSQQQKQMNNL